MYDNGVFVVVGHFCQLLLRYITSWLATTLATPKDKCTDAYPTLLPGRLRLFPSHCPLRDVFSRILTVQC